MNQEMKQTVNEIKKAVIGKDEVIIQILVTLLSRGHILLEDIPGVGKTNLALALSKSLQLDYHRIQLTPDIMPSDIVGFTMYNPQTQQFEYKEGIAFCHLLLADEMNRTSSKTQAALLELMEEGQMTVDGKTYVLYIGRENCSICHDLLPTLQQAQINNNYITQYLDILEVDRSSDNWKKLVELLDQTTTTTMDEEGKTEEVTETYGYFLDKKGFTPCVILIKDGKQYGGFFGNKSLESFEDWLANCGI